jgi:hypothetical protein
MRTAFKSQASEAQPSCILWLCADLATEERILKKPNVAKLQAKCDAFNEKCPVGTPVRLKKDFVDEPIMTTVKHPAYVMCGHSAVAFFEGVSGCYDIRCASGDTSQQWDTLANCWRKTKQGKGPAIAPVAARA